MKIAIVGATGLVGREILKVIEESNFNVEEVLLFASKRSKGKKITYQNTELIVKDLEEWELYNFDYALFSAGGETSKKYIPLMNKKGIKVIDNSSAFRMDSNIPLVVPSVNKNIIKNNTLLISNPNCSTIQMVVVLDILNKISKINRVVVSTYQSVSGAGQEGVDELINNTKSRLLNEGKIKTDKFKRNIDLNCIPHIDVFLDNDYTKEEQKMIDETSKIMGRELPLTATCVRVPSITGHSESVNIEFEKIVSLEDIKNKLNDSEDIILLDDPSSLDYPVNSDAKGTNHVFVGRIRKDNSLNNAINLWIVADNIRVGAATNAVRILKHLLELDQN